MNMKDDNWQKCDYQSPNRASKSVKNPDLTAEWGCMGFYKITSVNSFNFADVKTKTNGFHLYLITL